jgi:hypothetical protein
MKRPRCNPETIEMLRSGETPISDNSSENLLSPIPRLQKRTFWHKTGIYALCVLSLGTVMLLLALSFLTFLWKGVGATATYNDSKMASAWRTIMMKAWASRVVTLSSLVIRLAIAAQAGVATSMLAALLLERSGVPVHSVAKVSLIRSSNTGPHHLASLFLRTFPRVHGIVVVLILFTMVLSTLLSQFCSTVLLSDLKPAMIVAETNVTAIPFGRHYDPFSLTVYQGIDYWATKPPSYPAFAEYSKPSEQTDVSFHTGKMHRALLPFSDPLQRSLVRNYSGMTTVTNLQTVCVRLTIQAKVWTGGRAPTLVGRISGSPPTQVLQDNPIFKAIEGDFNCTIPIKWEDAQITKRSRKEWTTGLCRIVGDNDRDWIYGGAFLFLNLTKGEWPTWLELPSRRLHNVSSDRTNWVWQYMASPSAGLELSASLCWIEGDTRDMYVDISSDHSRTEPTLDWNIAQSDYDSTAIRTQLGASKNSNGQQPTFHERGILNLSPDLGRNITGSNTTMTFERMAIQTGYHINTTAVMCTYCTINSLGAIQGSSFWVHRVQVAVFQDILTSTFNPALALQAQYFTLLQMSYYDFHPEMIITSQAAVDFFVEVLMPRTWNGYVAVVVVLVIHFLCVMLSVVLFVVQTRYSLLGNVWSAIGQVTVDGTESAAIAASAGMRTDEEVQKDLRQATGYESLCRVSSADDGQTVGILRRRGQ